MTVKSEEMAFSSRMSSQPDREGFVENNINSHDQTNHDTLGAKIPTLPLAENTLSSLDHSNDKSVSQDERNNMPSSIKMEDNADEEEVAAMPTTPTAATNGTDSHVKHGRRGDPRMHRAVAARLANPNLSLSEAIRIGGFKIEVDKDGETLVEGVAMSQRKNQLSRRIRLAKRGRDDFNNSEASTSDRKIRKLSAQMDCDKSANLDLCTPPSPIANIDPSTLSAQLDFENSAQLDSSIHLSQAENSKSNNSSSNGGSVGNAMNEGTSVSKVQTNKHNHFTPHVMGKENAKKDNNIKINLTPNGVSPEVGFEKSENRIAKDVSSKIKGFSLETGNSIVNSPPDSINNSNKILQNIMTQKNVCLEAELEKSNKKTLDMKLHLSSIANLGQSNSNKQQMFSTNFASLQLMQQQQADSNNHAQQVLLAQQQQKHQPQACFSNSYAVKTAVNHHNHMLHLTQQQQLMLQHQHDTASSEQKKKQALQLQYMQILQQQHQKTKGFSMPSRNAFFNHKSPTQQEFNVSRSVAAMSGAGNVNNMMNFDSKHLANCALDIGLGKDLNKQLQAINGNSNQVKGAITNNHTLSKGDGVRIRSAVDYFQCACNVLFKRCMLSAGFHPMQIEETNPAYLSFVSMALQAEKNRVDKLESLMSGINTSVATSGDIEGNEIKNHNSNDTTKKKSCANNESRRDQEKSSDAPESMIVAGNDHSDHTFEPTSTSIHHNADLSLAKEIVTSDSTIISSTPSLKQRGENDEEDDTEARDALRSFSV